MPLRSFLGHLEHDPTASRLADAAGEGAIVRTLARVGQIPLGGTATGTGLNTHRDFAAKVRETLSGETGLEIRAPEDPFEAQGNRDALVELSGALKVVAVSLTKIANDLALMGSGPRAGIGELFLPELQKGSSIMPGKVNPVMPECLNQIAFHVVGADLAVAMAGERMHAGTLREISARIRTIRAGGSRGGSLRVRGADLRAEGSAPARGSGGEARLGAHAGFPECSPVPTG